MKIGKLAEITGLSVDTIRYYEHRGILPKPARGENGYRRYSITDVGLLRFIVHAKGLGFTLEETKSLISLRTGKVNCSAMKRIALSKADDIAEKIKQLAAMQKSLENLAKECDEKGTDDHCPILNFLEEEP